MSRPTFYEPETGIETLSAYDLHCVLLLAGDEVPPERIQPWTDLEKLLAYDYAMREHLLASDNIVRRRPCPYFVIQASRAVTP